MNPNETKTPNLVGTTPTTRVQGGSIVPITDTATGKAITSDILGSNTPVPVPTIPTSTVAQGLSGAIDGIKTSAQATLDQQNKLNLENAKAKESSSATDLKSIVEQQLGIATDRANLETEAKIAEKSQAVTNVTNQIEASQRAQTNELRALQEDKFLTPAQLAGRTQEINRKYAFEQADLALIQSAANRDYDTAQNIVDRKIQLQLEPLKLKYDYYKAINEGDKSAYTDAQKNTLKNLETKAENELKKAENFETTKASFAMQALKDGNTNLFSSLNKATNKEEVVNAVYNSTVPTSGKSRAQAVAESIFQGNSGLDISSLPIAQRAEVTAELNKLKQSALASGDITGTIKASAGGKPVSDSFTQSFEKALNVIGQLDELKSNIATKSTGPIKGIIDSNNPYDTKAQLIKAQLQAIVPNLARGIYGEVGVLTDNDVALYARTIANLKSTEDVNNAVMGMTIRSVQRSLENKIKTQAGFGRDVSGILDTYQGVKTIADSISTPNTIQTYEGIILPN